MTDNRNADAAAYLQAGYTPHDDETDYKQIHYTVSTRLGVRDELADSYTDEAVNALNKIIGESMLKHIEDTIRVRFIVLGASDRFLAEYWRKRRRKEESEWQITRHNWVDED